ncbi:unnamed protein product, partial [Mesorhabditis belari]|uniref:Cytochrome c1 n=1 Tax=Mesorhabditis belari TaxID=2138241 RepID=A0AAF3EJU4_9BILA
MQRAINVTRRQFAIGAGLVAATATGGLVYALENQVHAMDNGIHPPGLPWSHRGTFGALDIGSVRRGWEVYKQVCQACHQLRYFVNFRHFCDYRYPFMSEEEAKAEAEEFLIDDVDDKGQPIRRPAKLNDAVPAPYQFPGGRWLGEWSIPVNNDKAAAAANNGALPPELSLMMSARTTHHHRGDDYIFCLLNGYFDPPAGITLDEGKAYNPYFPGGLISMPQQLFDEGIEYKDGTPATQAQQAKDVTNFLTWCSIRSYNDTGKRWALELLLLFPVFAAILIYSKRSVWSMVENEKILFRSVKGPRRARLSTTVTTMYSFMENT